EKSNCIDYLFENCGDLLAFFFPGFFLSTTLESLVRSPIGLRIALNDGSNSTSALVIPCLSASACAAYPPPSVVALIFIASSCFVASSGSLTFILSVSCPPHFTFSWSDPYFSDRRFSFSCCVYCSHTYAPLLICAVCGCSASAYTLSFLSIALPRVVFGSIPLTANL
ncbi:MAG: hypothetical protein RL113_889, partial [Pseudomonadota bacterium]